MDRITITAEELETMQRELRQMESAGRTDVAARIKTAREWGDLKENAEYHAAKEEQAHLETRILRLRNQIRSADVIERSGSTEVVEHGATVSFTDRESNRTQTFTLVSPHDADPSQGTLSAASPVARALLGHRVGDRVEVQTPRGARALWIDSIG
ncbi:MAG: transcription elongation factor GreA [Solirubrobacteraceae bacterium]|jgi:transcription elongation factor GreA